MSSLTSDTAVDALRETLTPTDLTARDRAVARRAIAEAAAVLRDEAREVGRAGAPTIVVETLLKAADLIDPANTTH